MFMVFSFFFELSDLLFQKLIRTLSHFNLDNFHSLGQTGHFWLSNAKFGLETSNLSLKLTNKIWIVTRFTRATIASAAGTAASDSFLKELIFGLNFAFENLDALVETLIFFI